MVQVREFNPNQEPEGVHPEEPCVIKRLDGRSYEAMQPGPFGYGSRYLVEDGGSSHLIHTGDDDEGRHILVEERPS